MKYRLSLFVTVFAAAFCVAARAETVPGTGPECEAIGGELQSSDPNKPKQFYDDNLFYPDPVDDSRTWKFGTPAANGLDAAALENAATHLASMKKPRIQGGDNDGRVQTSTPTSLVVVRNGELVFERYFNGGGRQTAANIHSASKSMLSAGIGIALAKGLIHDVNEKVPELLPDYFATITDPVKQGLKLGDLLTMRSGMNWEEDVTETYIQTQTDWARAILALPFGAAPGTQFNYNTGLTHLMSVILTKASGMSTCDFMRKNLLDRIGIYPKHWGRDPQGFFSGGYDVYFTPREMAKFGMLMLNDGKWHGHQVVPAHWVRAATSRQTEAHSLSFPGREIAYGYNWWVRKIGGHDMAYAWGWGGQFIYVIRDLRMVVVITTDTTVNFVDEFDGDTIIEGDVLPAVRG